MKRQILIALLLLAIIVVAAFISASPNEPLSVRSRAPGGAKAFLRFLQEMGVDAKEGEAPPAPTGTFFLFHDLRGVDQSEEVVNWIERGGRVVTTSPASVLVSVSGTRAVPLVGALSAPRVLPPDCLLPEITGVSRISVNASDLSLEAGAPSSTACFASDIGSLFTVTTRGQGSLVVVGGPSLFINRNLHREDNAVLALNMVRREGPVIFGPPIPPGSQTRDGGVWAAIPLAGKILILQVILAAIVFALVRARRLGKPVLEEPISPIPASELVRATAELYRSAHATSFAARLMRSFARRKLATRLGLPPRADEKTIEEALSQAVGVSEDRVSRLMTDGPIEGDADLIELGRELERIARDMRTTRV